MAKMSLFELFFGRPSGPTFREVSVDQLFEAASDFMLRQMCFDICVDMIANAIGRCDFRTYENDEEIFGAEHWLWNYEPNPNQNSTEFLHKLVDHLYRNNEALVIAEKRRGSSQEVLAVADSWDLVDPQVLRLNEYRHVVVGSVTFNKVFKETDVLRLRLHQKNLEPVLAALGTSWENMAALARKHYDWDRGQHWKVHINQIASGQDQFEANFAKMIAAQIKPFLENPNAVLPEFDGYTYTQVGSTGGSRTAETSEDIRNLAEDIFNFTARGFLIPAVLVNGKVEATADANARFLSYVIDPLCDQLQEEITRKRYGLDDWKLGNYLRVDSSSILHFDLFGQASSIEKLLGSGVSFNDIMRAAGRATISEPWADEHFMTKNIGKVADVLDAAGEQKGESE
ncbi:MAG: phage portal protein [Oscillospiraceae bacterium]|nr:phage portal protein [Oscillospiraceae bacterium]